MASSVTTILKRKYLTVGLCLFTSFTVITVSVDESPLSGGLVGAVQPLGLAGHAGVALHSPSQSGPCPAVCFCSSLSRIIYCSRRGLKVIPDGIAADSLQLNINGNLFEITTLRRSNFSGLASLEHLYISECGVEIIQVCVIKIWQRKNILCTHRAF